MRLGRYGDWVWGRSWDGMGWVGMGRRLEELLEVMGPGWIGGSVECDCGDGERIMPVDRFRKACVVLVEGFDAFVGLFWRLL